MNLQILEINDINCQSFIECLYIVLENIIVECIMFEIFDRSFIAFVLFYCNFQKIFECIFVIKSYLMRMSFNSNFQHEKTQLNWIEIRKIKRKIHNSTIYRLNKLFETIILMYENVIHDNNVSKNKKNVTIKQNIETKLFIKIVVVVIILFDIDTR